MRSTSILFVAVAALAQFVAATPPACLIAAVGVQTNPADTKVLCGTGKDWVIGNITESCADATEGTALNTFKSTCEGAGYTITLPSATATATSASKTSSASSSKTSSATTATASDEDVSDVWGSDSANGTTTGTGKGSVAGGNGTGNGTEEGGPNTNGGSALSAGSSIFLGTMIAVAGLASQLL